MAKNTIKQVLMNGLEVTYGTDPVLDATAGMLVSNLAVAPMAGSIASRQKAHATFGADADVHVGTYQTLSFDVGLAGSGAAGTAPLYGPILRSLGLSETTTAATKVEYNPIDDAQESSTSYFNWDKLLHKLTGCRGTASLKFNGAALPMISVSLSSLFNAVTDANPVDINTIIASTVREIEVNKANTTTCTLHGVAVTLESLQIDLGNVVEFRDRPNAAYVALTDRKTIGTISFEAPTVAGLDIVGRAKAGTLGALALVHGTVAGNIVQLDAANVQLQQPTYSKAGNTLLISSKLQLVRANGNDELKLTFK